MAASITHAVITDKVFDKYFIKYNKQNFFVGTLFPDIRNISRLSRNQTHLNIFSVNQVYNEESSFMAGVKFHSLVDFTRNKYIASKLNEIIFILYKLKIFVFKREGLFWLNRVSKFFEDELNYSQVVDWHPYISYLNSVYEEELDFSLSRKTILKWHCLLQKNFSKQPDKKNRKLFLKELGWDDKKIKKADKDLNKLKKSKKLKQILIGFYDNFEQLVCFS